MINHTYPASYSYQSGGIKPDSKKINPSGFVKVFFPVKQAVNYKKN
jgi:hypothetical protein